LRRKNRPLADQPASFQCKIKLLYRICKKSKYDNCYIQSSYASFLHDTGLLLARLMGQYCFALWCLSASVVCRRL